MWGKWLKRIPWGDLLLLLVVTVLLGWVWVKGYDSGHLDAQRDGDKALAQLQSQFDTYRRESAEQQNEALRAVVARYNAQVAAAHKVDKDFQAKKQQLERENADLKKQIADVTRRWVDESGKSHPVKCVFTRGFVQQYNAALGVTATGSPVIRVPLPPLPPALAKRPGQLIPLSPGYATPASVRPTFSPTSQIMPDSAGSGVSR